MKLPFGWELVRATDLSGAPDKNPLGVVVKRRTNALTGGLERKAGEPNLGAIGGRKTKDNLDANEFSSFWSTFAQSKKANASVGLEPKLDLGDFYKMDINDLTGLMADVSPEFSRALWDYLLLTNAGFSVKVFPPNDVGGQEDLAAKEALRLILKQLGEYNGNLGVWFDRLFKMLFFRGSFLLELVLDKDARTFVDIATPDTKTLSFKRKKDPKRGQYWTFGQKINNEFVDLSVYPTIKYIPLHPAPDSIEGTPMGTSALFLAIFMMAVLRDVKRVIQHQGYLRLDVQVEFEKLKDTIPQSTRDDPEKLTQWMDDAIVQVQRVYETLEPDDTYVHSDSIVINNPVGSVSADSLQAIDKMFAALERMSVRALKSMPLLLATSSSRSETQANREWEIYSKGVETLQHFVESACQYIFELALEAQGIQAKVELKFETFRAAEKMRDAQVDFLVARYARFVYDCGVTDMDDMAHMMGFDAAKAPEVRDEKPKTPEVGLTGEADNPNAGEGRMTPEMIRDFLDKMGLREQYDASVLSGTPDNLDSLDNIN